MFPFFVDVGKLWFVFVRTINSSFVAALECLRRFLMISLSS